MGRVSENPETALARTILIVEDEKEIQELLAHYLRKEGFSPILAPDGETAMLKARREKPALILLDILLPKADGLEAARDPVGRNDRQGRRWSC
jgi:two-component system phosphate regulon response regulator OmpR